MSAYYNEFDPVAAQWLRNLIAQGHIAPGVVDSRSIEDVKPNELARFTQCHFFAGVGVWSLALRRAGWPDDRPVWTGSCPCQPFSAAGEGAGFDDPRHLWPHWQWLIANQERRPGVIFGEQVASKDANPWIDLIHTDLENMGYAFGAVAFPSAGIGAPHIRDRTYWVADADHTGPQRRGERGNGGSECTAGAGGLVGGLADTEILRRAGQHVHASGGLQTVGAANIGSAGELGGQPTTGPANGFWRASDWLACTDGKWRPVEPGTQPLVDGAAARVGRLRAYGNAINLEAARHFVECFMGL